MPRFCRARRRERQPSTFSKELFCDWAKIDYHAPTASFPVHGAVGDLAKGGIAVSIEFSCPACSQQYRVKDEFAGRSTKCVKCKAPVACARTCRRRTSTRRRRPRFPAWTMSLALRPSARVQKPSPAAPPPGTKPCPGVSLRRCRQSAVLCVAVRLRPDRQQESRVTPASRPIRAKKSKRKPRRRRL